VSDSVIGGFLWHIQARPRLIGCAAVGVAVGLLAPNVHSAVARALLGWNAGVWLFLVLIVMMMIRADQDRLRRVALAQAEGATAVLALVVVAAVASVVAIIIELAAAKGPGAHHALPHILFALATVTGSWLMLPTLFALNYASLFYQDTDHGANGHGLKFPEPDPHFEPDYADFMYFSFTIAVASQTADVSITNRPMRRLVLLQSLLSFLFNTTILAFTINIAAGLF
jgi:uncharacterized membrane protein